MGPEQAECGVVYLPMCHASAAIQAKERGRQRAAGKSGARGITAAQRGVRYGSGEGMARRRGKPPVMVLVRQEMAAQAACGMLRTQAAAREGGCVAGG